MTLIGGEAYLREDWDTIARAIVDRGMRCGITTGGRGLDADRVRRAVDAGVGTISVSIDGLERTHDLQRGARGSWRAAVEAAQRVAATPMRLATNTQINRLSMPELVALADLLHELGSEAWQLQLTVPMGRAADRPELLLQPYDLLELFPLLAWIKREKLTPRGIRVFPGNNIGYFSHYEEQLRYGGDGGTHWAGCGAGSSCLGVEADGKIKGCPSLTSETWTGGLSRERRVEDVLETPELRHIGERTRDDLWGFCRTCYYADVCRAGCTWTSEVLMGRPGNNPYCIHRALTHEREGRRERLIKVDAAPGRPFDHGRFETVVEPIEPPSDSPTILGVDLETVMSLRTDAPGVWTDDEGKRRLRIL